MTELPLDLWALHPLLVAQAPLDAAKLASVLQAPVAEREIHSGWTGGFSNGPVLLAGGVTVEEAFLRVGQRDPANAWALVLTMGGSCVPRAEVLRRYERLEITGMPRGGPNEETSWSRREPWGKLAFGFAERRPDCLSSVLIAGPAW